MPRIFSGVIRALENIYSFPDSQKAAPGELEIDLPIQVVHDVSRMAGHNAGLGERLGYWIGGTQAVHVGAGSLTLTPSPYDALGPGAQNSYPARVDVLEYGAWLYDMWCRSSVHGNQDYAYCQLTQGLDTIGPIPSGQGSVKQVIRYWPNFDSVGGHEDSDFLTRLYAPIPILTKNAVSSLYRPFFSFLSAANGATVTDMQYRFWLGKRGTTPPGM